MPLIKHLDNLFNQNKFLSCLKEDELQLSDDFKINRTYLLSMQSYCEKINEYIKYSFSSCIEAILNSPDPSKIDCLENELKKLGLSLFSSCSDLNNISMVLLNFY